VTTKATDTTADAPAKTADMTADMTAATAAGAETSDVTAAKAANATAGTPAKTTDVTAAKAPAASSAATATGIGSNGHKGHHEDQHRGNGDASLQYRLRVTDQIRSCRRCLSRERTSARPRTEGY
jgi:hypothetical protein